MCPSPFLTYYLLLRCCVAVDCTFPMICVQLRLPHPSQTFPTGPSCPSDLHSSQIIFNYLTSLPSHYSYTSRSIGRVSSYSSITDTSDCITSRRYTKSSSSLPPPRLGRVASGHHYGLPRYRVSVVGSSSQCKSSSRSNPRSLDHLFVDCTDANLRFVDHQFEQ